MNNSAEPDCSIHQDFEDPAFEDVFYNIELSGPPDSDTSFACRVRRWDISPDTSKPVFLMIPGIGHNCNFFNPLVKCMSIPSLGGGNVSRVYAIDLPGHGASGLPPHIKFGMLRLENYVEVIDRVIMRVMNEGARLRYIVGHSMGGMLVMLLEKMLLHSHQSLHHYDIEGIILLASALPEEVRWRLGEGLVFRRGIPVNLLSMLLPYVTFSPSYLLHARLFNEDFVKQFFGVEDAEGNINIVPGAPTGDALTAMNSAESYIALSQLGGLDFETGGKLKRPEIAENIFTSYTLGVAGYSKDVLFLPKEEEELCEHLSNGKRKFKEIDHAHAVHDDPYSCPCETFKFIKEVLGI